MTKEIGLFDKMSGAENQNGAIASLVEPLVIPSEFAVIVSDPPWEYPKGFATQSRTPGQWKGPIETKPLPYPSMAVEEICALPVKNIAAKNCRLWLWTTNRYLPFAFDVMKAWDFIYKQTLVWHKTDGNMGGSVAPNSAEFLLVGTKGTPGCSRRLPSAVVKMAQSKQHSKKPDDWIWFIEQTSEGPYLEMFARRRRPGWFIWGNEVASDICL